MSCRIRVTVIVDGDDCFHQEHEFICGSLALMGKTANFILAAWSRRLPINFEDASFRSALRAACDTFVVEFQQDEGSNNGPALKHMCDVISKDYRHGLVDTQSCEIHISVRIRNSCLDLVASAGKFYSLGKLFKIGSYVVAVANNFKAIASTVERVLLEPQDGHRNDTYRLFDLLFDLQAEHHKRGKDGSGKSQLLKDIDAILALVNDDAKDFTTWVHLCLVLGVPCCSSQEDCQMKLAAAFHNFFCVSGIPEGSLSRFTHITMALNKVVAGIGVKRILPRALQIGGKTKTPDLSGISPEELGAGAADMGATHATRILTMATWIIDNHHIQSIVCLKVSTKVVETFEYGLFGHKRNYVSLADVMHRDKSPITKALVDLWSLLRDWRSGVDEPWELLRLCGVDNMSDVPLRRMARRQVVRSLLGAYKL